jgi:hypothetical protein
MIEYREIVAYYGCSDAVTFIKGIGVCCWDGKKWVKAPPVIKRVIRIPYYVEAAKAKAA